jgi:predicted metal-dependent hydrolase
VIAPRNLSKLGLSFVGLPRHWLAGNASVTHLSNALNLLFPKGERFFVRAVRHYEERITDPELRADVRAFYAQEGRHALAHERFIAALIEQGFELDGFMRVYDTLGFDLIERFSPPALRLASTAALEHFTAMLAEAVLTDGSLQVLPREMAKLYAWHAVEELEHKAVAFDVLRAVHPGYFVRAAGMLVGATSLAGFWAYGAWVLAKQDGMTWADFKAGLRAAREAEGRGDRSLLRDLFARGIRDYLRPGFHPNDKDTRELVADVIRAWALDA